MNRNASSTLFGYQFQINVAVFFMFHFLKDILSLKVEGKKEDIEINLTDKKKYMIQAKSNATDLYNTNNDLGKLKKSLLTLSEADDKDVSKLFYASNMINPLNTETNEFSDNGVVIKTYNELSPQSKKIIDNQIKKNIEENSEKYSLNKDKLVIIRIPFFGEFDSEKYKYIYEEAKESLALMSDTLVNKHKTIVSLCESRFLNNGSENPKIVIKKEDFCNWIILTEIESLDLSNDNIDIGIDELDYYEAYRSYSNYIDEKVSTYENYSKVYSLYNKKSQNRKISIRDFVKEERITLYNYFFNEDISEVNDNNKLDVYVAQMISYAILQKKSIIDKIKKEANL